MKYWILTNGPQIVSVMSGEFTPDQLPSGFQIETDLDQSVILSEYGLYNGELVHVGPRPNVMHKLDNDRPEWIIDKYHVENYRLNLKQRINNKREELLRTPFLFYGNYYDVDEKSITNLQMWRGQTLPDGFVWLDSNNESHTINSEFIDDLLYAIAVRQTHLYKISWDKKAEIDSLDYDGLMIYDVDSNWG